ncbi:DNA alkylation repair protein [Lampropedia puyangensis]|uniref:DNA alkylation repair protein n=1 Tax=Lampropedia puyangensis TaxID=1330072 RepID=A0A4V4GRC8_9BURK|nr:DNA alkylation repair protein [Lampropedia puyangensis]THU00646.1 DNA alkylation repair protein [Lampropedia puyangensis]
MTVKPLRKGASRTADIPADILAALSHGTIPSATLTEGLALDQSILVRTTFPHLSPPTLQAIDAACKQGILKRMRSISAALLAELGNQAIDQCQNHLSDTVRGWACFMVGHSPYQDVNALLNAIHPLADDAHFGVREWAWLGVRAALSNDLQGSISALSQWTASPSERVRRFACEALRPRGVWCAHIAALKRAPSMALPILQPLRTDPCTYVQDSVANWLNDAAKDHPHWVQTLCTQWLHDCPCEATARICLRAQRNL